MKNASKPNLNAFYRVYYAKCITRTWKQSWTLNFLTVLGERVVSSFVRTADDFESTFPRPPGFGVGDGDAVLLFEMILNSLGSKFRVWTELREDFGGNKLFIDVAVPEVLNAMTGMSLSWFSNSPSVRAGECRGIEVLGALFVFAFEDITIKVFVWDKFIAIEESSIRARVFQSRKTLEWRVDCKLGGFVLQTVLRWCITDLKITRDRAYTSTGMRYDSIWENAEQKGGNTEKIGDHLKPEIC